VLKACEKCDAPFEAPAETFQAPAYCAECGAAFPWRALAVEHAHRTIQIAAAAQQWNDGASEIGREFVDDLVAGRMTPVRLHAVFDWLGRHNPDLRPGFVAMAESIGSEPVLDWLQRNGLAG